MTDAEFRAWLARDNERRCVLVELDYLYEGADSPFGPTTGTLYLSDREYFDDVTDHAFIDVVRAAPQYSRSLSGDRLGSYASSLGTLELDNADGELDFLLNLACDGSQIRFYYGGPAWAFADFKLIFTAITSKVSAPAFDRISVALKDTGLLLDKSIGGTSTVGGTGPNADRARPVNIGYIHNMQPLVLDEAIGGGQYVYDDDGTGATAEEVRDRGVSVAFTDNLDGTFELTAPPDGAVTADVLAEPIGSGNVAVSDAMDHLIGGRAGLSALGLYAGAGPTFTVHDGDDYLLGVSLPEARNVIDLLDDLVVTSGNGFWAIKRTGEFTFGRLRLNDIGDLFADSPAAIDPVDIYDDDVDQGTTRLDHAPTQYYRFQGYMSRNWSRQTDFASSLSPDQQAVYSRNGLYLMQPDSVGTDYENAPELYHKTLTISPVIDTLLSEVFSAFDLDSLAQWMTTRRAMLLPWIEIVSETVGIDFYQIELGDPIRRHSPRFGWDDGALFQVIGIVLRLTDAKIELRMARRAVIQEVPDRWTRIESTIDDTQPEFMLAERPMSVPIDLNPSFVPAGADGGLLNIGLYGRMFGFSSASSRLRPPEAGGFDKIVFRDLSAETYFGFRLMKYNFNVVGGSGEYSDYATYIADGNGASGSSEDFDGYATPGSPAVPVPSFAPVWTNTIDQGGAGNAIFDAIDFGAPDDFVYVQGAGGPALMTIIFASPIHAWGAFFFWTSGDAPVDFYLGATLVHSTFVPQTQSDPTVMDAFLGFAA